VIDVDLEWLNEEITPFRALAQIRSGFELSYRWGTVYAIRFEQDDFQFLEDGRSESIRFFGKLAPSKIVAKAQILDLGVETTLRIANNAKREDVKRFVTEGSVKDLRYLISSKPKNSVPSFDFRSLFLTESELDTRAGRNIAEQIF
jgi:hypothetical protein